MPFPEQVNLPFNFSSIRDVFQLLQQAEEQPAGDGYWAIMQGNSVVAVQDGSLTLPTGDLPEWLISGRTPLCIGLWQGRPLRAYSISSSIALPPPFVAEPFNASENRLDMATLTVAGLAKQVLHWVRQSQHCSRCGSITEPIYGTWGRRCTSCKSEHYPHIHPCAIVLVKRGHEVLLSRKAEWPQGRYGLIAGFVDFGESLEECAQREVREETGIEVENIRYVGSQNWPFPAQLMAGFVADYASGEIIVDRRELEDARWFNVDELPVLPPPRSIARWILDNYAR